MKTHTVGSEYLDMRLDRYVLKAHRELSKIAVQKMIRTGKIKLNGKKADAGTHLKEGDRISVFSVSENRTMLPQKKNLPPVEIVYEDEYFLAVNKPAGLLTHPDGKKEDSLTYRIIAHLYEDLKQYHGMFVPGVVTRLDVNTSGIVLAPKTPSAAKAMNELMQKNKFVKKYLVLVKGDFPKRIKAVHYALKDSERNKMELYDTPQPKSEEMITVFDPLYSEGSYTLLSAQLLTGKTHQIRAQLGALGFPVAGDIKYGDSHINRELKQSLGLSRQFLHCYSVSFPMWTDFSTVTVLCAPPPDLDNVLRALRIPFEL
ncbi:MAG: RluA family pseudouridine synthase [Anaerofustis sp.]